MDTSIVYNEITDSKLFESVINPLFNNEALEDSRKWEIIGVTKPKEDPCRDLYFVTFKANTRMPLLLVLQSIISRVIQHRQETKLYGFNPVVQYNEQTIYGFRPGSIPKHDQACIFYIADSQGSEDFLYVVPGFINAEGTVLILKDNSIFTVKEEQVLFWSLGKKDDSYLDSIKNIVTKFLKKFNL